MKLGEEVKVITNNGNEIFGKYSGTGENTVIIDVIVERTTGEYPGSITTQQITYYQETIFPWSSIYAIIGLTHKEYEGAINQ